MSNKSTLMNSDQVADIYNIARWSEGYFQINDRGEVSVSIGDQQSGFPLSELVQQIQQQQLQLPVLVRFPHILHDRVNRLHQAFSDAIQEQGYQGRYTPIYPIKVNQQRRVVEEVVNGQLQCLQPQRLGLEAGSKPELLAVLTEAHKAPTTIVCNGYKDREYIELALIAEKLGHHTYIVIEKASELALVLALSEQLNISPRIGIRARLATIGKGYWQNTGGEKSKFGLTAGEILKLINQLKQADRLDALQLLHFHLGSQIANIQDIQNGLRECTRFFAELRALGAPVAVVDVGGGLGVDYEGTGSRSSCSMNYSVPEYARQVVRAFHTVCDEQSMAHPEILTESGRAVTAHHAVLITNTIESERRKRETASEPETNDIQLIWDLWQCQLDLNSRKRPLSEIYYYASQLQESAKLMFSLGQLSLTERAQIDDRVETLLTELRQRLDPGKRNHREILDHLNELLADKLFVNFSLFQSLPDVWGLEQIFPILPLTGLLQPITRRAVIQDITCDSDGRIDHYVEGEGIESTLPMPELNSDQTPLIGFFMVGAYQEILGDMHNLFGDTDSVDAYFNEQGELELRHLKQGDSLASVLRYVDFDPQRMLDNFRQQVSQSPLSQELQQEFLQLVQKSFHQRTYLQPNTHLQPNKV
jgi:arginine decarboxylase